MQAYDFTIYHVIEVSGAANESATSVIKCF